jgi:hypothetical protein
VKIGNLEIRWWKPVTLKGDDGVDRTGAFAVADDTGWWLGLQQLINKIEAETIVGARNRVKETNECIAAVGAGEGVALVRRRLMETRAYALAQDAQAKQRGPTSAWD